MGSLFYGLFFVILGVKAVLAEDFKTLLGGLFALVNALCCIFLCYEYYKKKNLFLWCVSVITLSAVAILGLRYDFYDYESSGPTSLEWISDTYWIMVTPIVGFSLMTRWLIKDQYE